MWALESDRSIRERQGKGWEVETSGEEMAQENVLGTTMRHQCKRELGRDRKKKRRRKLSPESK